MSLSVISSNFIGWFREFPSAVCMLSCRENFINAFLGWSTKLKIVNLDSRKTFVLIEPFGSTENHE